MKKIDEPEFIVSSEELRKNRERALLRDEQMAMSDRAVENCIDFGNSESFCNAHLRG